MKDKNKTSIRTYYPFKKKRLIKLIVLFILTNISFSNAQEAVESNKFGLNIGLKTGINRSNIIFTDDNSPNAVRWEPIYSAHYGITGELVLFKKLGIQSEVIFNKLGFTTKPLIDYKQYYNGIDIPVMLKFRNLDDFDTFTNMIDSENVNASIMIGPYFKFLRTVVGKNSDSKEKVKIDEAGITKTTWGLMGIASTEYTIDQYGTFGLQIGGQLGLKDLDTSETNTQISVNAFLSIIYIPSFTKF